MNVAIKPILKYPGAKWNMAPWIVAQFPEHYHYLEPYCGSAACFFLKKQAPHEVLNDINHSIVNLFQVVRDNAPELIRLLELTPWAEEEYRLYLHDYHNSNNPIENARRFLVRCWQGHGSRINPPPGWRHSGTSTMHIYNTQIWKVLPDRICAVIDRLKDAEIRNKPALEMIAYYNHPECLIYADPPYVLRTRSGKCYSDEMTDEDHIELLETLDKHPGPVVLSGYAHPIYDERLQSWTRLTLSSLVEGGKVSTEVLWLNPKAAQEKQLNLFEDSGSEVTAVS